MREDIKERIEVCSIGKVPDGYKKCIASIIPNDWNEIDFCECATIQSGLVDPKKQPYSDMKHIGPENIEKDTGRIVNVVRAKDQGLISGKFAFDENSIIYSKVRPKLNKVCMPEFDGICSADCYVMQVKENINKEYLYWFILSEYFLKQAIACSMRTKMPKVNQNEINSFKINVPSLREQSGIVKTLKTYEYYCELLQKLIKQKVKYFELLAEQLLNGKIRIPNSTDKWKEVKIGQFIEEINEKTTHNNQYEILSVTKNGICLQKDQFNKQIASNDNIGYKIVRKGNLVFSTMNLWMGSLDVLNSYNIGMVSPAYKVFKFNSNIMLNEFGKYYMKSKHMIWRYKVNSEQGASVVRRNLDLKGLLNNVVSIPTVYEQRNIAEILMAAEKEIKLLEEKMQYVQQEKKNMMKLLLSGTVRMNEIYGDELYG